MTRDRSLDEFLDAGAEPSEPKDTDAETEPESDTGPEDADAVAANDEADAQPVAPAVSTYAFSPDGAPCAACGAVVEKRWLDDGELVCPDCKQW